MHRYVTPHQFQDLCHRRITHWFANAPAREHLPALALLTEFGKDLQGATHQRKSALLIGLGSSGRNDPDPILEAYLSKLGAQRFVGPHASQNSDLQTPRANA